MKASYEALQQFTQTTDVGMLSMTPTLALPANEARDAAASTVVAGAPATKKQKKYDDPQVFHVASPFSSLQKRSILRAGGKR